LDPLTLTEFYTDGDGDGFGDPASVIEACTTPAGAVDQAGDCDDGAIGTNPAALDIPQDTLDQDCDGADAPYTVADLVEGDLVITEFMQNPAAVLDAAGYGAAIAHRGVRLVRIPTTVLAQDDAAMGVKNGVNRFGKKNFVGAFAVPFAVLCDELLLESLPDAVYRAGFSEAVKIALLKDPAYFARLERDAARIAARDLDAASPAIRRSAELHLRHIVDGGDPFEANEARPLDFGHWAAHRLESMSNHAVSHGDAVALGLLLDCRYSNLKGWLSDAGLARIRACMAALGLPMRHALLAETSALLAGLEEFREHLGGRLTITMLRSVAGGSAAAATEAEQFAGFEVHELDPGLVARAASELA
jgi:3-dehydroquinate synthetase